MNTYLDHMLSESHFTLDNISAAFYFGAIFWNTELQNEREVPVHEHAWYEFHCVKSGEVRIETNEGIVILRANECCLLAPKTYHSTAHIGPDTQHVCFGFELSCNGKRTLENLYESISKCLMINQFSFFSENDKIVDTSFELLQFAKDGGSPHQCRFHNLLAHFLFLLSDQLNDNKQVQVTDLSKFNEADRRLFLLDYFSADQDGKMTLDELSKKMYLNKKQINRIVKKRYNMTFKQKQIRFRIENAKKQLQETNLPVDTIASLVGYTNLTSFYKAFRSIVGMTPRNYRIQHSKTNK